MEKDVVMDIINTDSLDENVSILSQDEFVKLLEGLDEETLSGLLERAGLSQADAEAAARQAESEEENDGLTPEMIGQLLHILGEDGMSDLVETASKLPLTTPSERKAAASGQDCLFNIKQFRFTKRLQFVVVICGLFLILLGLNQAYMNAVINSNDPIDYSEPIDEISCSEGSLNVNNVGVVVPTDGTEEYKISYAWAENDEEYPSVPHAITALYSDDENKKTYSITLYRNETIQAASIPEGKSADNWFDDWSTETEADIQQAVVKVNGINGFYVCPKADTANSKTPSDYNNYSFYFAVSDNKGINIYVIEGICLNETYVDSVAGIMDNCIESITIKMPDAEQL